VPPLGLSDGAAADGVKPLLSVPCVSACDSDRWNWGFLLATLGPDYIRAHPQFVWFQIFTTTKKHQSIELEFLIRRRQFLFPIQLIHFFSCHFVLFVVANKRSLKKPIQCSAHKKTHPV